MKLTLLLAACTVMACGNVYDRDVPPDLEKADESFRREVLALPEQERTLLAGFVVRAKVGEALGSEVLKEGVTVRQAIDRQRKFVAELEIKRVAAEAEQAKRDAIRAEREAKEKQVQGLLKEAMGLVNQSEFRQARAKLAEASLIDPADDTVKAAITNVEMVIKRNIAGKWLVDEKTNRMTDDKTVVVKLNADNEIRGYIKGVRPALIVRCLEAGLSVYIHADAGINADYGELHRATGRYRFDQDSAERIRFGISDSLDAVFFPDPQAMWIKRLAEHTGQKLHVEIPTYQNGGQIVTFDLAGADVAVGKVLGACGK